MKREVHTGIYGKCGCDIIKALHKRWIDKGGPGIFYASGITSKVKVQHDNEVVFDVDDDECTIFSEGEEAMRRYVARYIQNNILIGLDLSFGWYGALPSDFKEEVEIAGGRKKFKAGDLVALKAFLEGDERQQSLFGKRDQDRIEGHQADPVETEINAMIEQETARLKEEYEAKCAQVKRSDTASRAKFKQELDEALAEIKKLAS